MRYMRTSKDMREARKKRFFKALDYDPDLNLPQLMERFGITNSAASTLRKEWREKNEV